MIKKLWGRFINYYVPHFFRYVLQGNRLSPEGYEMMHYAMRVIMEQYEPVSMREHKMEEKLMEIPTSGERTRVQRAMTAFMALVPLIPVKEFKHGWL